jgi:hypothetical protein
MDYQLNLATFRATFNPSFCNNWPKIAITINEQIVFCEFIDQKTTVNLDFEIKEQNKILITYLNKRSGPDVWDTEIDQQGNIINDQYCILSDIYLAGSRCDFLIPMMSYYLDSGITQNGLCGFMAYNGHYEIKFPKDIYSWIVESRHKKIKEYYSSRGESSLAYFESYASNDSQNLEELLTNIDTLIEELSK